jgi:DNA-binding NarL/FixJ family response regulator
MTITVFLADDHTVFRDGLRLLLEAQGDIKVIGGAANGRETVRQVEELYPDVVVMDVAMPELNGIEATRQICETCPSTQIIILSMYCTTEHVFQALRAGASGYLPKESAGIEVVNAVHVVHSGHHYLNPKISDGVIDHYLRRREAAEGRSPLECLSAREREVLQLVVEGKSSAEIASVLSLSPKTVQTYRSRMMRKLSVSNLPSLIKFAVQHGLTPPE